jgi:hypothetical protein
MTTFAKSVAGLAVVLSLVQAKATIVLDNGSSDQPGNSGQGTIQTWLAGLVTAYDTAHPTAHLPAPGDEVFRVNHSGGSPSAPPAGYSTFPTFGSGVLSITLPMGDFDYVALHWGGSGGGVYQAYYVGDDRSGSLEFSAPGDNGLSWYDTFGPIAAVPEPTTLFSAAMVLVFPVGLTVLRNFGRKRPA